MVFPIDIPPVRPPFSLNVQRQASGEFSECTQHEDCSNPYCTGRLYRYLLRLPTDHNNDRICLWILANPSTATPDKLDPTIRKCLLWSQDWGFGWCHVVNVRAWRATHPETVPEDPVAIGPMNDRYINSALYRATFVMCGWGQMGGDRGKEVLAHIRRTDSRPHAFRFAANGAPYHPLYIARNTKPIPFPEVVT